ncbi:MAG TPA: hypothetical protein VGD81_04335 [Opitutaceae bacterium]
MSGKNVRPPPSPAQVLSRVLGVATIDGRILVIIAATFALLAAAGREPLAAIVGCLAAGAGSLELHGVHRLKLGAPDGVKWLVRSQLFLLLLVLAYATIRFFTFDAELVRSLITPEMETQLATAGLTVDQALPFFKLIYQATYVIVALVSCIYQGGLARYYRNRRGAIRQALGG